MNSVQLNDFFTAAALGVEIAVIGAFIAGSQLRYAKKRDAALDERNTWADIHKAMVEFLFRRALLTPSPFHNPGIEEAEHAGYSLHLMRAEFDRAPDWPLVTEISTYLNVNDTAEKWRSTEFSDRFCEMTQKVAEKSRPPMVTFWF